MSEKSPESKDSLIQSEEVYRKRDQKKQEEMEKIRKEIERDKEERENHNKNKEELEELKKEWSANGSSLSEEKQARLNRLEDLIYEKERNTKRNLNEDVTETISEIETESQDNVEVISETEIETETNEETEIETDTETSKETDNKGEESNEEIESQDDVEVVSETETEIDTETNKETDSEEMKTEGESEESEVEHSSEKSIEEILEEKRNEFAKLDRDAESWVKIQKKYRKDVTKETYGEEVNDDYNQVKSEYFQVLNDLRLEKINALNENLSPQEREKEIERIFKETVNIERINLHEAKLSLSLKEKPEKFRDSVKENTKKIVDWYRKLPLRYKLSISAGLLGTGAVAGLAGGATGVALATGAFAGVKAQRVLSGAATAVGLEGLIKRSQEKKAEKQLMKQFAENLEERIKSKDSEIDKRILELEGKMTSERIRRYIVSGMAGVLVGSGAVGRAVESISDFFDSGSDVEKLASNESVDSDSVRPATEADTRSSDITPEEDQHVRPATEADTKINENLEIRGMSQASALTENETVTDSVDSDSVRPATEVDTRGVGGAEEDFSSRSFFVKPETLTAEIKSGSSVWATTENYLQENLGSRFSDLSEGQRTYLIDQIKDKIAENPAKFGLEGVKNIDSVQAGQVIDFSSIVEDGLFKTVFETSENLSQEAIDSVVKNNEVIAEWVNQNPGQSLTTEKVNEIIEGSVSRDTAPSVETVASNTGETSNGTFVEEKTFDVKSLSEQYRVSEDFVNQKLQIVEASGLEGNTKEALVKIYLEDWNDSVSFEKTDDVLKNFLGEEYLRLREFSSGSPEIFRDDIGNVVMNLDNEDGTPWNNRSVIMSPEGTVSLNGPTGLQLDKAPLNSETLERIKEMLSASTR